jgi:hypothetical protein
MVLQRRARWDVCPGWSWLLTATAIKHTTRGNVGEACCFLRCDAICCVKQDTAQLFVNDECTGNIQKVESHVLPARRPVKCTHT